MGSAKKDAFARNTQMNLHECGARRRNFIIHASMRSIDLGNYVNTQKFSISTSSWLCVCVYLPPPPSLCRSVFVRHKKRKQWNEPDHTVPQSMLMRGDVYALVFVLFTTFNTNMSHMPQVLIHFASVRLFCAVLCDAVCLFHFCYVILLTTTN